MPTDLENLIRIARGVVMTGREREAQRRSFAFGNTQVENSRITRETVNREADKLAADGKAKKAAR